MPPKMEKAVHSMQYKKNFFLFANIRAIKNGSGGIGKMKASENAQRHNIKVDIRLFKALFMFMLFLSLVKIINSLNTLNS